MERAWQKYTGRNSGRINKLVRVVALAVVLFSSSVGATVSMFASYAALDHNPQQEFCIEHLPGACNVRDIQTAEAVTAMVTSGQIVWRNLLPVTMSWFAVSFLLSVIGSGGAALLTYWIVRLFRRIGMRPK